jgi:L-seryl-tRNA(Ser) seleniumtransferase
MKRSGVRAIPSVDKILHALGDTELPRPVVVSIVRKRLVVLRREKSVPEFDELLEQLRILLREVRVSRIQRVINGTGVLIHTNFGRAPLGAAVVENLAKIASNYNNLEYGIAGGERGGRAAYLERCLALLCEAEAATVVNNNAAALILILRHFCAARTAASKPRRRKSNSRGALAKTEVIISRGELVQIGGGFRIPEILEASGARLQEVGTTNKTSLSDYARAITSETALILKVHRSNFYMGGFVDSPRTGDIATLAREKRIPFVEDLGSGAIIDTSEIAGLEHETTPGEVLRAGVDLMCFSGDKLLGGPQAGIIAGKAEWIAALKREPFFRALRCDKLILSALETVADSYLRDGQSRGKSRASHEGGEAALPAFANLPVITMLRISSEELRARAQKIVSALDGKLAVGIGSGKSQVGGGTLPRSALDSITLDVTHSRMAPQELAARLRGHAPPLIGYLARGKFKLDLRTIFPSQDEEVILALRSLLD